MSNNNIFNDFSNLMNWINNNDNLFNSKNTNIKNISPLDNNISNNSVETINEHAKDLTSDKKNNKKLRCEICKAKINLVDEIISTCKCNKNHCLKHRMPEIHNCEKIQDIGNEQRLNLKEKLVKLDSKFIVKF